MMRKRVVDEPQNLNHNVVPKRAEIGQITADNALYKADPARQLWQQWFPPLPLNLYYSRRNASPSRSLGRRRRPDSLPLLHRVSARGFASWKTAQSEQSTLPAASTIRRERTNADRAASATAGQRGPWFRLRRLRSILHLG
jgi:hypothetical protein